MTWMRVEEMEKKMQKCAEDPKERMTTPQADGFFMPGEYEPHDGCILIWPSRPGSWIYGARDARIAFRDVIAAIAQSENVYVAAGRDARLSDRVLTTEEAEKLEALCTRREQREPLQYLCGIWSFLDFDLAVGPGVLCPRADSEVACETAIELLQQMGKPEPQVLDLCAGTGCLGIGIRHFVPSASVTCVEKSPQALQYLQANVHGTGVQAKAADVLQYWRELMPQSVQLIISNPPYLTGAEMQALMPEPAHEPAMALDGGTDGLDFYRAIAAHYRDIVCPGGWLVFEIGCAQRADVMEICRQNSWQQVQARKDYGGNDRVVYAQQVK